MIPNDIRQHYEKGQEIFRRRSIGVLLAALEAAEARAVFQEAKCNAAYEAVAEQAARADIAEARAGRLEPWLNAVLNQVDYTRNYCKPTEMVGAVLDKSIIKQARHILESTP